MAVRGDVTSAYVVLDVAERMRFSLSPSAPCARRARRVRLVARIAYRIDVEQHRDRGTAVSCGGIQMCRGIQPSLSGFQDRGHDDRVAQVADGPEPLRDGVNADGLATRGVSLDGSRVLVRRAARRKTGQGYRWRWYKLWQWGRQ